MFTSAGGGAGALETVLRDEGVNLSVAETCSVCNAHRFSFLKHSVFAHGSKLVLQSFFFTPVVPIVVAQFEVEVSRILGRHYSNVSNKYDEEHAASKITLKSWKPIALETS